MMGKMFAAAAIMAGGVFIGAGITLTIVYKESLR